MNWRVLLLTIFTLNEKGFAVEENLNQLDDAFRNTAEYAELADFFAQRPDLAANQHCRRKAELNLFRQAMDTVHCPKDEFMQYLRLMERSDDPSTQTFADTEKIRNNYQTLHYASPTFTKNFLERIKAIVEALKNQSRNDCSSAQETLARLLSYLVREESCSRFISDSLGYDWHTDDRNMSGEGHLGNQPWFEGDFAEDKSPLGSTPDELYNLYIADTEKCCKESLNLNAFIASQWMNVDKCSSSYDYFIAFYFLANLGGGYASSCFYDVQQHLIEHSKCFEWEGERFRDFIKHLEMAKKSYLLPCLRAYLNLSIASTDEQWIDAGCVETQRNELRETMKSYFGSPIKHNFSNACINVLRNPETEYYETEGSTQLPKIGETDSNNLIYQIDQGEELEGMKRNLAQNLSPILEILNFYANGQVPEQDSKNETKLEDVEKKSDAAAEEFPHPFEKRENISTHSRGEGKPRFELDKNAQFHDI